MLLDCASAAQVDASRGGDHVGSDALASFVTTASTLVAAFRDNGALSRLVHHPIGDRTGAELLSMRVLDVAVHTWDLARALGADEILDPDLVTFALAFTNHIESGRRGGSFALPIGTLPTGRSPQHQLLHLTGRQPLITEETP